MDGFCFPPLVVEDSLLYLCIRDLSIADFCGFCGYPFYLFSATYGKMMTYPNFSFDITFRSSASKARLGRLSTPHGVVETPAFIFCATKAAIKGATPQHMRQENTQIILANTYHLMLQPGPEVVAQMGGLHKFMGWNGPLLTDSG